MCVCAMLCDYIPVVVLTVCLPVCLSLYRRMLRSTLCYLAMPSAPPRYYYTTYSLSTLYILYSEYITEASIYSVFYYYDV